MRASLLFLVFSFILLLGACQRSNPNVNEHTGEDKLEESRTLMKPDNLAIHDTVYVPIYSSIYSSTKDSQINLTATLSIRNTSLRDTIYVHNIDYYDGDGKRLREYIDYVIFMKPMESIEYVIDEMDLSGGTGAHFIVNWGSDNPKVEPIFQGVMISTFGQQGISFLTEGISISQ